MGRKDLVVMNTEGNIYIKRGIPALYPALPSEPTDGMSLAKLIITPYPSLAPSYAQSIDKTSQACTVQKTAQRRYTMRDIGVIDSRISNLEVLASLNLLEKNSVDMKILDADGNDRFKNGIFADPFTSHVLGDITNIDYKIAIDGVEGTIRPFFEMNDVKLVYGSGSGLRKANNLIMLNYSDVMLISQPYASKNRNTAGEFYKFKGVLTLNPPEDYWVDTQRAPDVQINIDGMNDAWQKAAESWDIQWNSWQSTVTGVTTDFVLGTDDPNLFLANGGHAIGLVVNQGGAGTNVVTTTTTNTRTGTRSYLSSQTTTENIGDSVLDVSVIPYIRPQVINLTVLGMKATTQIFAFFDSEAMSAYCTPCDSSFNAIDIEGSELITDSQGRAFIKLRLPTTGKQFRTGTKKVRLTDSITDDTDATTSAENFFTASGLTKTVQSTIVSTTTPVVMTEQVNESFTTSSVSSTTAVDPVSQTFFV
jgi:hypothetical protein